MKLLYRTAEWHGFAKLRMHRDFTLDHLEELTKEFGQLMRQFRDFSCTCFRTVELPREVEARKRWQHCAEAKKSPTSTGMGDPTASLLNNTVPPSTSTRKPKKLNIFTYKFHALGDYVQTIQIIRLFGGTDSFSTQLVKLFCHAHNS